MKGECEGETTDDPVLDGLLDDNRLELIKKHANNVRTFMNHGWPTDGMFTLAANDGISRAEIEEYLRREGTA